MTCDKYFTTFYQEECWRQTDVVSAKERLF